MKATPDTLSHNPTGVLSTLRHVEMWTAIRNERHVALIICYSNGNCTRIPFSSFIHITSIFPSSVNVIEFML